MCINKINTNISMLLNYNIPIWNMLWISNKVYFWRKNKKRLPKINNKFENIFKILAILCFEGNFRSGIQI